MKSFRIILIALFSFFYVCSEAQVFVAGSFGFTTSGGSVRNGNETTDRPSSLTFSLSPKAGKFINEKLAAGIGLNFWLENNKTPAMDVIDRRTGFGVVPFVRYYPIKFNKFSVYGQGNVNISYTKESTKVGATTTDGPKTTGLSLNIAPGLSYDLNDRLSLETSLDFMSLEYYMSSIVNGNTTTRGSGFKIGAGLSDLIKPGSITIGAIYKF